MGDKANAFEPRETGIAFQVACTFDRPGLSVGLEMPRLPSLRELLFLLFFGDMLRQDKWSPGFYEVTKSTPGVGAKEKYSGTICLRRLSLDEYPDEIKGDCFVVGV